MRFSSRGGLRASRSDQSGIILVTALILLALLAVALGTALWLTRTELWAAGSARAYVQARYTAEAGARHALALLAPGGDFESLLAGTGGLSDPARPGPLLGSGGARVGFPGSPFGYDVSALAAGPDVLGRPRVVLRAHGTAVRGAERIILATIGREALAYAPAALSLASGTLSFSGAGLGAEGAAAVVLDAGDAGATDPTRARAALGAASSEALADSSAAAASAHATLLGATTEQLVRGFDIAAFVAASGIGSTEAGELAAAHGSPAAPVAFRTAGGTAPRLSGAGVLLVDGDLEIAGEVDFSGVMLVGGVLRFSGAPCQVRGAIWARAVVFAVACTVRLEHALVDAVDATTPLPRRPILRALVDG